MKIEMQVFPKHPGLKNQRAFLEKIESWLSEQGFPLIGMKVEFLNMYNADNVNEALNGPYAGIRNDIKRIHHTLEKLCREKVDLKSGDKPSENANFVICDDPHKVSEEMDKIMKLLKEIHDHV